ncbi:hypothetical protein BDZ91DRAFT_742532, partial [Kalaharituber pfeilii]
MRCPAEVVPVDGVSKRHFFFFFGLLLSWLACLIKWIRKVCGGYFLFIIRHVTF